MDKIYVDNLQGTSPALQVLPDISQISLASHSFSLHSFTLSCLHTPLSFSLSSSLFLFRSFSFSLSLYLSLSLFLFLSFFRQARDKAFSLSFSFSLSLIVPGVRGRSRPTGSWPARPPICLFSGRLWGYSRLWQGTTEWVRCSCTVSFFLLGLGVTS